MPDPARFDRGQRVHADDVGLGRVVLEAATHDPVNQQVHSVHIVITESGLKLYPVKLRYAWPAELDLMARLAGLRLTARFGGWGREPFTVRSGRHVSVYGRR